MSIVNKFVILVLIWFFTTQSVQSARRSISSSSTINDNRFSLLWIDDNDKEFTDDNYETQRLLRQYLPSIELESDISDAILFINRVKYTDKILIIVVSGQKASLLFQYLTYYNLNGDVGALYIFCNNPNTYQNLKHDRLYGIFNDPTLLVASIRTMMYAAFSASVKTSTNLLDQEQTWSRIIPAVTTTQIWYDLYLEILKVLPTDEQAKEEMLEKSKEYYADDTVELLQINLFLYTYTTATAIEWYTDDTFVHKLVNKALRRENIELLSTFRFFIGDLSTAIKQEYINQQKIPGTIASNSKTGSSSFIKLFSGQVLPRMELERLEQNLGTVIAINSFFSTSIKLNEARAFADRGVLNANMGKVLIEILLDTSLQDITAYAQTNNRTQFLSEEEIVFDCGALFNVTSVEYDPFTNIWNIEMTVVSKTSINEHPYLTTIRETFIQNHSDIVTYGIIMGHGFDKKDEAIQYFNRLLSNYWFNYEDIPDILQQRGILYEKNGESALAVHDYELALEIHRLRVPKNLLGMASLYSHIGIAQKTTFDYQTSLISHEQAMDIYDQLYTKDYDHVDKARVNVNIGLTYLHAGNSSEALKYLTYAQATYKRLLPEKHLFAIELLGHLGTVHETTGNFILAMELFYQQLRQSEEILLADHSQLITSLGAIMRVQTKMNQTSNITELLSEYQQKLSKTLDYHHPSLVHIITMTASLLESSEPVEAIRLYDQVFEVSQKSKQSNYSLTLKLHRKLAELNRKIGNPMEALDHALQALKIQQQFSLEQGNRSLEADDLHTIGSIYLEMKLFTDALQYLIKSLAIYQAVYASDHPSIQAVLIDIVQAANQSRSNQ